MILSFLELEAAVVAHLVVALEVDLVEAAAGVVLEGHLVPLPKKGNRIIG